jgi:hypothetical protein
MITPRLRASPAHIRIRRHTGVPCHNNRARTVGVGLAPRDGAVRPVALPATGQSGLRLEPALGTRGTMSEQMIESARPTGCRRSSAQD